MRAALAAVANHDVPTIAGLWHGSDVQEQKSVGLEVNDLRIYFADDGRHFKDKEGGNPLPMLSEAQQMLSQRGLISRQDDGTWLLTEEPPTFDGLAVAS